MPQKNNRAKNRLVAKLHQKAMKGSHFLRTATWDHIDTQTDKRVYEGPEGPLDETWGRLMFDTLVKMTKTSGTKMAIQLFSRDNRIVEENVGLLNNGFLDTEKEVRSEISTNH